MLSKNRNGNLIFPNQQLLFNLLIYTKLSKTQRKTMKLTSLKIVHLGQNAIRIDQIFACSRNQSSRLRMGSSKTFAFSWTSLKAKLGPFSSEISRWNVQLQIQTQKSLIQSEYTSRIWVARPVNYYNIRDKRWFHFVRQCKILRYFGLESELYAFIINVNLYQNKRIQFRFQF